MKAKSIYMTKTYREAIKIFADELDLSLREICQKTRINTSYFSRVMKEKADFSADQIYQIAAVLGFRGEGLDYFAMLREREVTSIAARKNYYQQKIEQIRQEKTKLVRQLGKVNELQSPEFDRGHIYYSSNDIPKVHMCLTLLKYRNDLPSIAKKCGIKIERVKRCVAILERLGLVETVGDSIRVLDDVVHLEQNHEISPVNHSNWRLDAIERLRKGGVSSDYSFSVCFSANQEAKVAIQQIIKDAILDIKTEVDKSSQVDDVFFMTMDLMTI